MCNTPTTKFCGVFHTPYTKTDFFSSLRWALRLNESRRQFMRLLSSKHRIISLKRTVLANTPMRISDADFLKSTLPAAALMHTGLHGLFSQGQTHASEAQNGHAYDLVVIGGSLSGCFAARCRRPRLHHK